MNRIEVGNCLDVLRKMPDNSIDSVVTDPPYGLSFMGKKWDYDVPSVELWAECLRVLKPGGHLLAFAGTRTQHRMAVRIEDAGFEIRDMIAWVYGCLDDQTMVATASGVQSHRALSVGDEVLCYDAASGEYSYQPVLEIVEYDYSDTAYRLVGDSFEHVVSRNHRVLVERGGSETFVLAEALECEARVPVLESLPELRQALRDAQSDSGSAEQGVQQGVRGSDDRIGEQRDASAKNAQGLNGGLRCLRGGDLEAGGVAAQGTDAYVQSPMQRGATRGSMALACAQGSDELERGVRGGASRQNDGRIESGVEGRPDATQSQGEVCGPADQVRALPGQFSVDGAPGRLRDAAQTDSGAGDRARSDASRGGASLESRCDGQRPHEPDAVRDERTAQGIRAWGGHSSVVVRVVPFRYVGKVWCLRVPTGAFVAVRGGAAFPTGNSGFPKSLDVSKAIDKAAGAEREVVGIRDTLGAFDGIQRTSVAMNSGWRAAEGRDDVRDLSRKEITAPATEAAKQWQGWGTALKPALEPITVARKPLIGTVAENVLAHGTGALNIDGCRVGTTESLNGGAYAKVGARSESQSLHGGTGMNVAGKTVGSEFVQPSGRWPANLIHDGSEEVLAGFPVTTSGGGQRNGSAVGGVYGDYKGGDAPRSFEASTGSAARFFYCAKASRADRGEGNNHPTVKPTDLMRYLCRLVTPPGGVVLDPFAGSGSTGKAASLEGFRFIGIELDPSYAEIAKARIGCTSEPATNRAAAASDTTVTRFASVSRLARLLK